MLGLAATNCLERRRACTGARRGVLAGLSPSLVTVLPLMSSLATSRLICLPSPPVDCRLAPFNTTSNRMEPGVPGMKNTPGPGEYASSSLTRGATPAHRISGSSAAASFASKTARDMLYAPIANAAESPGPGQYKLPSSFESKAVRRSSEPSPAASRAVLWKPKANPPSIPTANQSFGYEETEHGELVMQRAPNAASSAGGHKALGPGAYNPDAAMKWTRPSGFSTAWGNSRVQRKVFDAPSTTPGPGAYATCKDAAAPRARGKVVGSAAFVSRVPLASQSMVDSEKIGPGPGQYEPPSGIRAPVVPVTRQTFGSTAKRSEERPASSTPGPGHYNPPSIFGQRRDPAADVRVSSAFSTSAVRFKKLEKVREPGPGAYDEYDQFSLLAQVQRKTHGRNGAFGSTSRRFAASKAEPTPGVGTYDPAPPEGPKDEHVGNAAFASNTHRFERKAPPRGPKGPVRTMRMEPSPGPMQYSVMSDNSWNKPKPTRQGDGRFGTSVERFPANQLLGQIISEVPGPMSYSPKHPSAVSRKPPAASGDFGKQGRFGPSVHQFISPSCTPGPGQYDTGAEVIEPMIKRSFNITLS
mgnify:CR=1 FL=1